jgi:hypothetical protein
VTAPDLQRIVKNAALRRGHLPKPISIEETVVIPRCVLFLARLEG